MNKVTTAALAGLMVVAAGAQASDARWNGFGASSLFIADVQGIFTLPGVVASHADTTYFELGAPGAALNTAGANNNLSVVNQTWGGVHSKLGGGVLGVWFNRTSNTLKNLDGTFTAPDSGQGGGYAAAAAAFTTDVKKALSNQIDLVYGYSLSDATTLGFGFSRGTNSTKTETVTTSTTSSETNIGDLGFSLGVEQKEVGPIALLEVGLQYNTRNDSFVNKGTATDKIMADGSAINLRVGGDLAGENGAFGRVELGLNTASLVLKNDFAAITVPTNAFVESKNSALGWNLGYAMGMSSDKGMGLCGLNLHGNSTSKNEAGNGSEINKSDASKLALTAVTAGEAKLNSWLTFRAGLESDLYYNSTTVTEVGASGATTKTTTSNDAHAGTVGDPSAKASMGVSLTLGDLILDSVFNQGLLYSGPYFVSGIPAAYSTQVSLTWPWGGSKN